MGGRTCVRQLASSNTFHCSVRWTFSTIEWPAPSLKYLVLAAFVLHNTSTTHECECSLSDEKVTRKECDGKEDRSALLFRDDELVDTPVLVTAVWQVPPNDDWNFPSSETDKVVLAVTG